MIKAWAGDFSRLFVDSGRMGFDFQLRLDVASLIAVTVAVLGLALYSLWFLWRNTPPQVWLFVFALVGVTSLTLVTADLVLGRRLSTTGRYLIPSYFGLQIAISYLLSAKINAASASVWKRRLWQQTGVLLALGGITSSVLISQAPVWWNHSHVYHNPSVALIINRSTRPLLISDDTGMGNVFSLTYLLKPETQFQLVRNAAPEIAHADRDVFLYRPSEKLIKELGEGYELTPVYKPGRLWRVETQ
jgi:uncharacterized membrane protein